MESNQILIRFYLNKSEVNLKNVNKEIICYFYRNIMNHFIIFLKVDNISKCSHICSEKIVYNTLSE